MPTLKNNKYIQLIFFVLVSHLAGLIGSLFTQPNIAIWYNGLNKPSFSPPNWLFGPVWLTLYTLMGIAAWLVFREKGNKDKKNMALFVFYLQLVFNAFWSIVFFGLKDALLAFVDIMVLWILIGLLFFLFYRIKKAAAYLLAPYFIWVSFAAILNITIYILNN